MAKYNRFFLVPYIQDVFSLYCAQRKLATRYHRLKDEIEKVERGEPLWSPSYPEYDNPFSAGRIAAIIFAISFFAISMIICSPKEMFVGSDMEAIRNFLLFGSVFVPGLVLILTIKSIKEAKDYNKALAEDYETKINEDKVVRTENEKARKRLPMLKLEMQRCSEEYEVIGNLIDKVYTANVIPGQYRDEYAITYLYDYFANSHEDDLGMALNTYVLEQIKDRLDVVIQNQMEMVLNQAFMIANQRRSMEEQKAYSAKMEAKMSELVEAGEDGKRYLALIESNTAVSAYFASADFLRKI